MYFKTAFKPCLSLPILIINIAWYQKYTFIHCTKLPIPYPTKFVQDIKVILPNLDYEEEHADTLKVSYIRINR